MQEQSQPVKKTRHSYQTYVKAGFDDDTIQNHLRPKLKAEMFSDEQVEEEANATELIETAKCIGNDKAAFYMFDKELAAR